jgi:hypothetical protein
MYHLMLTGLGMLLIAAAGALGAPVWFDLLGRLLPLRAAGPPPQALAQRPAGPAGPAAAHSAFETHLTDAARSSRPPLAEEELSSGDGAGWRRLREALGLQVEGGADEALRDAIRRAQQKLGFSPTGQPTHLLLERLGISVGPVG